MNYMPDFLANLFFLCFSVKDEEQDVFKRDFSAPTLEDHFNKTILPKVMQVGSASVFTLCLSVIWKACAVC